MMLYLVALRDGLRVSDGVSNMASDRTALERWHAAHQAEIRERYPLPPDVQAEHDSHWTYVIVDRAGLDALPFAPNAYRPERSSIR